MADHGHIIFNMANPLNMRPLAVIAAFLPGAALHALAKSGVALAALQDLNLKLEE